MVFSDGELLVCCSCSYGAWAVFFMGDVEAFGWCAVDCFGGVLTGVVVMF